MSDSGTITRLLSELAGGRADAEAELLSLVYDELRRIAGARVGQAAARSDHAESTLQPTALVHEAYLRLGGPDGLRFDNRAHFFTAAAEAMRRILIEAARRRGRLKRGGDLVRVDLEPSRFEDGQLDPGRLLVLDELVSRLERQDREVATVVKLRHFVGLTVDEVARELGRSPRTVHRQWNAGLAWLKREWLRDGG